MSLPRKPKSTPALPMDREPEEHHTPTEEHVYLPKLFHERLDNWASIGELVGRVIGRLKVIDDDNRS